MAVRTISQSIDIQAPRERVWDVLLKDETYREWTAEFMEGSYAETDWQAGSEVRFLSPDGSGMIGRITAADRPELLAIEYDGMLVDGKADNESAEAQEIKGGRESYRLTDQNGKTHLAIESGMPEAYYDEMSRAWERALAKVKALAETA